MRRGEQEVMNYQPVISYGGKSSWRTFPAHRKLRRELSQNINWAGINVMGKVKPFHVGWDRVRKGKKVLLLGEGSA